MKETQPDELFEAWLGLPDSQRHEMDAECRDISELSCEKGCRAIIDEAAWHLANDGEAHAVFVEQLATLSNHFERAMTTFLDQSHTLLTRARPARTAISSSTTMRTSGSIPRSSRRRGVRLGKNTLVAAYTYLVGGDHLYDRVDTPVLHQGRTARGIEVDDNAWLGAHVVISDGSHVGRDAIIGAGAVVIGEIPPYHIAAGVPAKVIRDRRASAETRA